MFSLGQLGPLFILCLPLKRNSFSRLVCEAVTESSVIYANKANDLKNISNFENEFSRLFFPLSVSEPFMYSSFMASRFSLQRREIKKLRFQGNTSFQQLRLYIRYFLAWHLQPFSMTEQHFLLAHSCSQYATHGWKSIPYHGYSEMYLIWGSSPIQFLLFKYSTHTHLYTLHLLSSLAEANARHQTDQSILPGSPSSLDPRHIDRDAQRILYCWGPSDSSLGARRLEWWHSSTFPKHCI